MISSSRNSGAQNGLDGRLDSVLLTDRIITTKYNRTYRWRLNGEIGGNWGQKLFNRKGREERKENPENSLRSSRSLRLKFAFIRSG